MRLEPNSKLPVVELRPLPVGSKRDPRNNHSEYWAIKQRLQLQRLQRQRQQRHLERVAFRQARTLSRMSSNHKSRPRSKENCRSRSASRSRSRSRDHLPRRRQQRDDDRDESPAQPKNDD